MHHCEVCGEYVKLNLAPDFSSTGLWCGNCGVEYGNPVLSFPSMPKGLISLIEIWVMNWDEKMSQPKPRGKEYFEKRFIQAGRYLCDKINEYYICDFKEENLFYYRKELDNN